MGTHSSLSMRISERTFLRYLLAVSAVITALVLSSGLNSLVGEKAVYVLLFPAIAFSAWYCGIGPSVVATVLALVGVMYGPITNLHSFPAPNREQFILLLAFVFSSLAVIVMAESRRRQNEMLRKSQGELEACVQERTADLDGANKNLRDLSARLLQLQDDERRRIARELHDSVGQMLAALGMNLSAVRNDIDHLA